MDNLLEVALKQDLGYGLFVMLLIYVLKTTGEREKNYQGIISKLTDKLTIVEEVKKDVTEIKDKIFK